MGSVGVNMSKVTVLQTKGLWAPQTLQVHTGVEMLWPCWFWELCVINQDSHTSDGWPSLHPRIGGFSPHSFASWPPLAWVSLSSCHGARASTAWGCKLTDFRNQILVAIHLRNISCFHEICDNRGRDTLDLSSWSARGLPPTFLNLKVLMGPISAVLMLLTWKWFCPGSSLALIWLLSGVGWGGGRQKCAEHLLLGVHQLKSLPPTPKSFLTWQGYAVLWGGFDKSSHVIQTSQ